MDASNIRYKQLKILGQGTYGTVYLVKDLQTNQLLAVKRLLSPLLSNTNPWLMYQSLRELELLALFKHKNVLGLKEAFLSSERILPSEPNKYIYLVTDYYPFDLQRLIYSPAYLYRYQVKKIMYDIMRGLNYLHSRKIVHRDIKPGNVLGNHKGEYCLCDFSLTRGLDSIRDENYEHIFIQEYANELTEGKPKAVPLRIPVKASFREKYSKDVVDNVVAKKRELTAHVMTRSYRAPEVILLEKYNTSIDIWGAGCIFGELLQTVREVKRNFKDRVPLFVGSYCYPLTKPPEEAKKDGKYAFPLEDDQITKIIQVIGIPPDKSIEFIRNKSAKKYMELLKTSNVIGLDKILPNLESEEKDLLKRLLEFNPELRITAKQALNHPYFNSIKKNEDLTSDIIVMESVDNNKDKRAILRKYCIDAP